MATRLGSTGRSCTGVSVGVSSSTVRELRLIRATVSTGDIAFGNDIRFASSFPRRPTPEKREGQYAVLSQYDSPVKPPVPRWCFTTDLFPKRHSHSLISK